MKDRTAVFACANADGLEKFFLMFIGTSRKLRAFKEKEWKILRLGLLCQLKGMDEKNFIFCLTEAIKSAF